MKNVAIIAGGKSPEHEVSVVSARNIYKALDKSLYNVSVIGISKDGQWFHLPGEALSPWRVLDQCRRRSRTPARANGQGHH